MQLVFWAGLPLLPLQTLGFGCNQSLREYAFMSYELVRRNSPVLLKNWGLTFHPPMISEYPQAKVFNMLVSALIPKASVHPTSLPFPLPMIFVDDRGGGGE